MRRLVARLICRVGLHSRGELVLEDYEDMHPEHGPTFIRQVFLCGRCGEVWDKMWRV